MEGYNKLAKKNYWVVAIILGIFLQSCEFLSEKVEPDNPSTNVIPEEIEAEQLTEEEVEFWDNLASIELGSNDIVLPNGLTVDEYLKEMDPEFNEEWENKRLRDTHDLGPQDSKNLLIAKLTKVVQYLTNRDNFRYDSEAENKPAQNGLAYSFGARNYQIRQAPPAGSCTEEVYGLDCSGFIYQILLQSGINLELLTWSHQLKETNTLETAIKSSYPEMDKIKVEDLGKIPSTNFESGDIIYWMNTSGVTKHIGMVLKTKNGNLAIAQSNGSAGNNCEKNYGPNRGPRFSNLNRAILPINQFGFGDNYGIVRINAEISGKWKMTLKCQETEFNWLTLDLDFPTSNTSEFSLNQSAYYGGDGVTYDVNYNFSYNNEINTLSCTFKTTATEYPDFYRFDNFSIKLERDDTGFFHATLVDSYSAGCSIDVRLENLEEMSLKSNLFEGITNN